MFKHIPLVAALLATPLHAQDIAARFVLINADAGRVFNTQEWITALEESELANSTQTVIDTDFFAIDRTIETAKAEGGIVAFFMTANLPTTEVEAYDRIIAGFLTPKQNAPLLEGLHILMQQPGCALIRKPLTGSEFIHTNTIATMNDPRARVDCFKAVMTFTMDNLDQFGPRTPFDQQIDEDAITRQGALAPMAIKSQALIDEAQGPMVRRASNIYKPGEKISFHANLLNIGRFEPGTSKARFEINLDIKVTRKDGEGSSTISNAHVYKGQSTHRIPVADDYFDNFVRAGFSLNDPGEYLVELVLTDLSRPDQQGTSVAVPYEVIIAQ